MSYFYDVREDLTARITEAREREEWYTDQMRRLCDSKGGWTMARQAAADFLALRGDLEALRASLDFAMRDLER
jgi:hypothetical protein